ncbi:MAG: hypothetical protein ABMA02_07755 [Saprospiraceae bacterium]
MKQTKQCSIRLALAFLWICYSTLQFAQGVQWTTSVNVGGSNGAPWAGWVLDVITTSQGNYLAVGFAKEDETAPFDHPDVPAYCLISPGGALLRDGVIETDPVNPSAGRLANVVEASNDSYYAVGFLGGFGGAQRLLVRINKNSLDAVYYQPPVVHDDPLKKILNSRLIEVVDVPGTDPYLLCSGWVRGDLLDQNGLKVGEFDRERWLLTVNYNGTIRHQSFLPVSGSESSELKSCTFDVLPNGVVRIFGASYLLKEEDGGFGQHRHHDSDIMISKIEYNPLTGFQTETATAHNSITWTARNETADAQALPTDIFYQYPPSFPSGTYDKYPYGPKYVTTPFERSFTNCNESAETNGFYIEDWSDGSEDVPHSMVLTSDKIVVSAMLNQLTMWNATNDALGGDPGPGLHCNEGACSNFDSDYYLWGEAYLLFYDKASLALTKATYLGTMSGGDFIPKVIKTSDGGFAVSGTVTGCPDGLPEVTGAEHMMAIKLDANGDVKWRKHYNGQGEGACGFAITETPDGGLLLAGNTEDDGQEHEENFGFIKFGSDCSYQADILPNSGKDYIVAADEPTWNTSRTVRAKVVVPNGRQLIISGSGTTIRFADSKEVYDAPERYPIGITVEPGGRLVVSGATLKGYDCNGKEKMWDGINVVGNPAAEQTAANQGLCSLFVAKIVNARQGVVASAVWCSTTTVVGPPYGGTGSRSSVQTSVLNHGGPYGGGRVSAWATEFIDNQRSAIFMKYPHNWNQSRFLQCKFISNGSLVDPNDIRQPVPNDYNNNEPRGTSIHASIWSTRVQFVGCEFSGSTGIIPEYRPFGIEGDDPKIVASGGSMKDLKVGIECRGALGGLLASTEASGITFDNVVQGINLRNSVADIVSNCTFLNIPEPNTYSGLSPSGIFGQFNKGALISNNEFHGADAGKPSWGIVEHNTQNQGCEIKENQFFTSRVGNQFEGKNTQLDASCNDYTGMGLSAWYAAVTFGAGQLKPQGNPGPFDKKADNEFFDFCDGSSNIHIEADDNFTPFGYYDKTGNPHPVDPDCVNDLVNVDVDQTNTSPLACTVPDPPCPNPPCDRVALYMASPKTIRDRNVALRGLVHAGFAADTTDLAADYEGAFIVLLDRNQPEDRSILVGSLAGMDRYAEAQAANALLTGTDAESIAYKAYLANILDAGADLTALPEANYQSAMASLTDENVSTRTMAENLRYLREGLYAPLIAVDPEPAAERSQRRKATGAEQTVKLPVRPNPFSGEVVFDLSGLDASALYQLVLTDVYGRQIEIRQAFGGRPLIWGAAGLPDGQYVYQIRSETAVIQSGKLLKVGH